MATYRIVFERKVTETLDLEVEAESEEEALEIATRDADDMNIAEWDRDVEDLEMVETEEIEADDIDATG